MNPERIRADVRKWAALGIKGLKAKGIHPDQLAVLIDEGHLHGLTIIGHLDSGHRNSVNPRDAIAMGIDRVEHFMGGDAIAPDKPAYRGRACQSARTDRDDLRVPTVKLCTYWTFPAPSAENIYLDFGGLSIPPQGGATARLRPGSHPGLIAGAHRHFPPNPPPRARRGGPS
jgi:hypothetical protein